MSCWVDVWFVSSMCHNCMVDCVHVSLSIYRLSIAYQNAPKHKPCLHTACTFTEQPDHLKPT